VTDWAPLAVTEDGWPGLGVWLLSWWITMTRYHWFSAARRRETLAYAAAVARAHARPAVTITVGTPLSRD
jgi:hypothetical protein